ncbi:MAG: N-acetylglucosamine-6-phosphate deacetylase [bacterium]|nr:N-acetylglucosamine-6-phosphate deacetylase [bacterium]
MFGLRGNIVTDGNIYNNWVLVVEDDHIYSITREAENVPIENLDDCFIVPGFIDIHTHGAVGYDVMDGNPEGIVKMAEFLASHGVTSFLPTTTTLDIESTLNAISAVERAIELNKNGAKIIGIHLEGPFINPKHKGAQNEKYIIEPTKEILETLTQSKLIKLVTIAPEISGAIPAIKFMRDKGIYVSLGHSDATYEDTIKAITAGATLITHLFNGMRPFHHREPGIIGAGIAEDSLNCQVIADGIHIHFSAIRLVYKAKGYRNIVLISDSMSATGLSDGEYELGGLKVTVRSGAPRLEDGRLAGSTLTLDNAIKNMVNKVLVPLPFAVEMASKVPAKSIGEASIGSLSYGNKADIVVLDRNFNVVRTYIDGRLVYSSF